MSELDQAVAGQQRDAGATTAQAFVADEFFSELQSSRLRELMERWRQCRDTGTNLASSEQMELESLVELELLGATKRAETLSADLDASAKDEAAGRLQDVEEVFAEMAAKYHIPN